MSRLSSARVPFRRLMLPVGTGICAAYSLQRQLTPTYFDSYSNAAVAAPASRMPSRSYGGLNPESMKQMSRGSMYGFGTGLLVGFLSHTLVLLAGLAMFTCYLAHRYGLDLPQLLGLKERLNKVALGKPFHHTVFRLSFAATFTLAAFVRF